jgi:hypothetical protein
MSKKVTSNKAVKPAEDKAAPGPTKALIEIRPFHAIGGVGRAGDKAWMDLAEAYQYVKDGYVVILETR